MNKPTRVGITLGDINGVGLEVALKAAHAHKWPADLQIVLVGSAPVVRAQAQKLGFPMPPVWSPGDDPAPRHKLVVWDPDPSLRLRWTPGRIVPAASRAASLWICAAVNACLTRQLHAMVTAPICKEGFHAAGINVPGHTELLAELTGTKRFAMMLFGGTLRVVLVTRHIPISAVAKTLSAAKIVEAIRLAAEAMPWMGWRRARIAVCGLNPHAGDGGEIGREEIEIISPAIRQAQRLGFNVVGPVPADTVFHQALKRQYDAVVAMYHDQGLAPLKMLAFDFGVNITLGLPLVRTSPDHGTAFDIAGKNKANPHSMIEAIDWAAGLAHRKNPWR